MFVESVSQRTSGSSLTQKLKGSARKGGRWVDTAIRPIHLMTCSQSLPQRDPNKRTQVPEALQRVTSAELLVPRYAQLTAVLQGGNIHHVPRKGGLGVGQPKVGRGGGCWVLLMGQLDRGGQAALARGMRRVSERAHIHLCLGHLPLSWVNGPRVPLHP